MGRIAPHSGVSAGKDIRILEDFGLAVWRDEIGEDGDKGVDEDQQDPESRRHRH